MRNLNITYERIKSILRNFPSTGLISVDDLVNHLYYLGIFKYKRKKIKKTTIKLYLNSLIDLDILTKAGNLTILGYSLSIRLNDEDQFKKLLKIELMKRKDIQLVFSAIHASSIPNEKHILRFFKRNGLSDQTNIANLLNLCADCGIIRRMRKTTYWKADESISEQIMNVVPSPSRNITDIISELAHKNDQQISTIIHEIAILFCEGKLLIDKAIPIELQPIIYELLTTEKKNLPIFVSSIKLAKQLEDSNITKNGEKFLIKLVNEYSNYFNAISWLNISSKTNKNAFSIGIQNLWATDAVVWKNTA